MNNQMRIQMDDSIPSALVKLCEGNPGALTVLLKCVEQEPAIDPDSALGNLGALFALDSLGIYGAKIWVLYKDICGSSIPRMLGVLRSVQLGFLDERVLIAAVDWERDDRQGMQNIDELLGRVKSRLPKFNLEFVAQRKGKV